MENMESIVNLALNSGLAIIITVYFLLRDWKFNSTLTELLGNLKSTLDAMDSMIRRLHNDDL